MRIAIYLKFLVVGTAVAVLSSGSCKAAGQISYGTRAGMSVTIRDKNGIDGDRAVIRVEHTRENAREFCTEYLGDQSEACIDKALREVRIADMLKGNCLTGQFVNLEGQNITFAGVNVDYGTVPISTEYLLFKAGSRTAMGPEMASGYSVNLDQFQALCPARYAQAMLALEARPKYIGRWYINGDQKVCLADEGTAEGLLTFKSRSFIGIETTCKFTNVQANGERYAISMTCSGEGNDWPDRVVLEVKNKQLQRTVMQGRKPVTFAYERCPF